MMNPQPIAWYVTLADPLFRIQILAWWMFIFLLSKTHFLKDSFFTEIINFQLLYMFSNGLRGLPNQIANKLALNILFINLYLVIWALHSFIIYHRSTAWLVCNLVPFCFGNFK